MQLDHSLGATVLVIGYVWPEPKSSAAGSHMLSLLKLFKAQNWQVVFASPAQTTEHMTDLAAEKIESVSIQLNDSSFDDYAAKLNPDYVLFDRFMMEEQFGWRVEHACPQATRILDTEDLQCLRQARHQALKQERSFTQKDLFNDIAKREIAAIHRSDLSLIISDYEIELLKNQFKVDEQFLHFLPFMLDIKQVKQQLVKYQQLSFTQRQHFVTIGNFRHAPNWDSVLYLQEIWPLIRQQLPEAELHIYGSYPPKKATQLNNPKNGFLIKGWAGNAFDVLANARVCLAPLRFGAGIKGKLIDAMQTGTPSVTTNIGQEGMAGHFEWPGLLADTTENFAEAAVMLYKNEALWQSKQQHIRPLLLNRYDKQTHGEKLILRIQQIKNNLDKHRLQNFTGAMLNHHLLKSTQYMSKWIEAKNKL